ncbi:tRNA (5-methylaminomethyl-2-thiouridine)(34)-methyltransferase MnmD [Niabella sp. CC-SYL272]|uniref:tRNA (5-methylaminomethyl-2-thiouridine)(34)-methyltransferase MnmD n=1 Tax=Niabella agricola TaxID=2891571 RepID=UPI001F2402C0|nr:tRNA (5-methylaminomethyl-2-thiouridine)(34)-methyltransferase MnmD [Niabella agricola]MCF3109159.1 tRNA (5-methylaminomethyl-2-thiouridine)(34)-methyltransferase MnmD [Niabella agricola]
MEPADYHIIHSGDGSDSVGISGTTISFHSTRGAFTESMQVFIENGLKYYLEQYQPAELNILEIGFGTGLNALLTVLALSMPQLYTRYTSIDRYPLPAMVYGRLNYDTFAGSTGIYQQLMTASWNREVPIGERLLLQKIRADLLEYQPEGVYDICYFDAFAPDDQPELWTPGVFKKIRSHMRDGGVLVTYCSKSVVRRTLAEVGFAVEKLKGPPGKREVVRATAVSGFSGY